ncbi:hypothetical protein BDV95DRAFT_608447 [Massariosphaeria phaeospora]|uniref:Uncharacterized protein n=1 Tax=Massariosphaeria phaeospora TaxID=100035 RepID=A0A7C8MHH9_9PLEO|nr:hypothetical protein BDV95DRAFT_608447 [Massariosphaeria phaeospora]
MKLAMLATALLASVAAASRACGFYNVTSTDPTKPVQPHEMLLSGAICRPLPDNSTGNIHGSWSVPGDCGCSTYTGRACAGKAVAEHSKQWPELLAGDSYQCSEAAPATVCGAIFNRVEDKPWRVFRLWRDGACHNMSWVERKLQRGRTIEVLAERKCMCEVF